MVVLFLSTGVLWVPAICRRTWSVGVFSTRDQFYFGTGVFKSSEPSVVQGVGDSASVETSREWSYKLSVEGRAVLVVRVVDRFSKRNTNSAFRIKLWSILMRRHFIHLSSQSRLLKLWRTRGSWVEKLPGITPPASYLLLWSRGQFSWCNDDPCSN